MKYKSSVITTGANQNYPEQFQSVWHPQYLFLLASQWSVYKVVSFHYVSSRNCVCIPWVAYPCFISATYISHCNSTRQNTQITRVYPKVPGL